MPDHEIVMLAALIADGSLTERTPRFCFGPDSPVLERGARRPPPPSACRLHTAGGGHGTATISAGRGSGSNPVRELCELHGLWGLRSAEKFVPDAIFGLDESRLERFLAVLYACDGHVYASDRLHQIGYSTISERLALDVQHLLLRLGHRLRASGRCAARCTTAPQGRARGAASPARTGSRRSAAGSASAARPRRSTRVVAGLRRVGPRTNVDTIPPAVWDAVLAAKGRALLGRHQRRHEPSAQPQLARRHPRPLALAHR